MLHTPVLKNHRNISVFDSFLSFICLPHFLKIKSLLQFFFRSKNVTKNHAAKYRVMDAPAEGPM